MSGALVKSEDELREEILRRERVRITRQCRNGRERAE